MGMREWVAGVGRRRGGRGQGDATDEGTAESGPAAVGNDAASTAVRDDQDQGLSSGQPLREQVNLTAYSAN
ncbi:MAG TPA: hypothetical protein VFE42_15995, partial [Chloroflexota bacterium]|nr:hypothetical protein [Chloroflexota bacterium]